MLSRRALSGAPLREKSPALQKSWGQVEIGEGKMEEANEPGDCPRATEKGASMKTVYDLCSLLLEKGRITGLAQKLDAFYACDRLNESEYRALLGVLSEKQEGEKA